MKQSTIWKIVLIILFALLNYNGDSIASNSSKIDFGQDSYDAVREEYKPGWEIIILSYDILSEIKYLLPGVLGNTRLVNSDGNMAARDLNDFITDYIKKDKSQSVYLLYVDLKNTQAGYLRLPERRLSILPWTAPRVRRVAILCHFILSNKKIINEYKQKLNLVANSSVWSGGELKSLMQELREIQEDDLLSPSDKADAVVEFSELIQLNNSRLKELSRMEPELVKEAEKIATVSKHALEGSGVEFSIKGFQSSEAKKWVLLSPEFSDAFTKKFDLEKIPKAKEKIDLQFGRQEMKFDSERLQNLKEKVDGDQVIR